jgi:hypothetical protein
MSSKIISSRAGLDQATSTRPWGGSKFRSLIKEKDVEKQIRDFLAFRGWKVIKTDVIRAGKTKRGYIRAGEIGQADTVCIRPANDGSHAAAGQIFFAELKRIGARTKPKRRESQAAWAAEMRARGFICYHAPDGLDDAFAHFEAFYRETFPGDVR